MKKYKIDHYLEQLPIGEYQTILQKLPEHLGISKRTFNRWRNIKLTDNTEIPVDKMFLIALLFEVRIEDMFTQKPTKISISELERHALSDLAATLGLHK